MPTAFVNDEVATAPPSEGVHIVRGKDGDVLYVGRTGDTRRRLQQHLAGPRDSSVLHKRVAELLDEQLGRPATGADVRDYLSRCTVEWIETEGSRALKDRLVQELRPLFSGRADAAHAPAARDPQPVPEALLEIRLQLLPYVGLPFRHLAQRPLNPENRSLSRLVVSDLLIDEPTLERGHWLTVSIDPVGGVPREQASITSDFDFTAVQRVPFEDSPVARYLETLLLVPVVKPSGDEPEAWYLLQPTVFQPDETTWEQYRADYEALAEVVAEGPPDDTWRELGRTGVHLRAKTNYTASNPTRQYSDRNGRVHEPKGRGWYFAGGYTGEVIEASGLDTETPSFVDEPATAAVLAQVRELRRAAGRPHKLYLLLCALRRLMDGAERLEHYEVWHESLAALLLEESPAAAPHPEYPFTRLVGDGLWEVAADGDEVGLDESPAHLQARGVRGGLPADVHALLAADRNARAAFALAALAHLTHSQREVALGNLGLAGLVGSGGPHTGEPQWTPVPPPEPDADPPEPRQGATVPAGRMAALHDEAHRLGREGELWVVDMERQRLRAAGREDLADLVDHVAAREDGAGYDVVSYDAVTSEPFVIEVKTTSGGPETPYFFSDNELRVSRERDDYWLYRVFDFSTAPRFFRRRGSLDRPYFTRPRTYSAHPQWRAPQEGT